MTQRRKAFPSIYFYSLLLFPLIFVLHGYNENFGLLPFRVLLGQTAGYLFLCSGILALSWLFLHNESRAMLWTILLFCFYFLFGAFHDLVRGTFYGRWFVSYTFLLPVILGVSFAVLIFLARRKPRLASFPSYISVLMVLLFCLEIIRLAIGILAHKEKQNFLVSDPIKLSIDSGQCATHQPPDIYFIILDGYSSSACLKEQFGFDNSATDSLLSSAGFHLIPRSTSNYNITPFSLSATLNLQYLVPLPEGEIVQAGEMQQAIGTVRDNILTTYLQKQGYSILNYGCLDLAQAVTPTAPYFERSRISLVSNQTLSARIQRDIGWNFKLRHPFTRRFRVPESYRQQRDFHVNRNLSNWKHIMDAIAADSPTPRFVYGHIMLPHEPYYVRADGRLNSDTAVLMQMIDPKQGYINQLIYTNHLLEELMQVFGKPKSRDQVVIIQGDHGFRNYSPEVSHQVQFMNLNAIYFSDQDYSLLNDSLSSVNTFRVVLNKYLCQSLPMLSDTIFYLGDKMSNPLSN